MVNPVPGYSVTTPYRRSGSWSCGYHTGDDYAAPSGARVVAARGGIVRHTSWGGSFGNQQFAIEADDGGWDFYAHTNSRPSNGKRVATGEAVADVGARGNATGPHLHFERRTSFGWSCSGHEDPAASHSHQGGGGGGGGSVYLTCLRYGVRGSDSVAELQRVLNGHSLDGGETLPTSGNYLTDTDHEVRLCQQQHGFGDDKPGESFVGPKQAQHLGLSFTDDRADPVSCGE